jgi:hypothetical protein
MKFKFQCAERNAVEPSAKQKGDVFSESRASSLAEGFENTAPAWLAKRSSAASSSVLIREISG